MIQRIQSLWLLIVAIAAFASYKLVLFKGKLQNGTIRSFPLAESLLLAIAIIILCALAIICIFLYKKRTLQFRLSVIGILLSFAFLFLEYLKVEEFKKENAIISGAYEPGAVLPVIMAIFFFLAARGIYKDQKLVKSLDRLR